jgi:hypothetical protein
MTSAMMIPMNAIIPKKIPTTGPAYVFYIFSVPVPLVALIVYVYSIYFQFLLH